MGRGRVWSKGRFLLERSTDYEGPAGMVYVITDPEPRGGLVVVADEQAAWRWASHRTAYAEPGDVVRAGREMTIAEAEALDGATWGPSAERKRAAAQDDAQA